jgi:hypothetical protein
MGQVLSNLRTANGFERKISVELEIDGKKLPVGVPQVHTLINERVANTTAGSLADKKVLLDSVAKEVAMDLFKSPASASTFGVVLREILRHEQTRAPTREFIFWTLTLPHIHTHIYSNAKYAVNSTIEMKEVKDLTQDQLVHWIAHETKALVLDSAVWALKQDHLTTGPMTQVAKDSIPYQKVSVFVIDDQ